MGRIFLLIMILSYCTRMNASQPIPENDFTGSIPDKSGYSEVNGIRMYYEIYGEGKPLVLIHGGGSTIQTSFGRIIPGLSENRQVIGVELQAHGRTSDRNSGLSFEQDADDVSGLLKNLKIASADFFGFSNGGSTAMQIAIRHPEMVNKLIVGSSFYKRSGLPAQFWEFMREARLENMPQHYKDAYVKVASDPGNLQLMHDKCAKRMVEFTDWNDSLLRLIKAPTLLVSGDTDVATAEHTVEMHRLISGSRLAIIPGGHGEYMGEITTMDSTGFDPKFIVHLLESFLGN
jgi:pimeloyl-ACP methyl ester carboxylesterase